MGVAGLVAIAKDIGDFVTGQAGPNPLTVDDLAGTLSDIQAAFMMINDALDHADREANLAVTAATSAATQAEAVGQDVNDITRHTYTVVIPHSLSWLAGYVVTTWVDPIRKRLDTDEHQIKFLMGWRGQIDTWRHKTVDPELARWRAFDKWFKTWPTALLNQWHEWMQHPARFGSYWAPYLVRPIVAWLGAQSHRTERDVLSLMMVDAWEDDPNLTWEAILRWVVKDS